MKIAINTAYYIGSAKVEEVTVLIGEMKAYVLIFNNELSPSQLRNIGGKLELDHRKIEIKIAELEKELERIGNERQTQRKRRNKAALPSVALVGYTNAGKSSIMNGMVEIFKKAGAKKVFEKDMLFAE